jgi:hypothetical protein
MSTRAPISMIPPIRFQQNNAPSSCSSLCPRVTPPSLDAGSTCPRAKVLKNSDMSHPHDHGDSSHEHQHTDEELSRIASALILSGLWASCRKTSARSLNMWLPKVEVDSRSNHEAKAANKVLAQRDVSVRPGSASRRRKGRCGDFRAVALKSCAGNPSV